MTVRVAIFGRNNEPLTQILALPRVPCVGELVQHNGWIFRVLGVLHDAEGSVPDNDYAARLWCDPLESGGMAKFSLFAPKE